MRTGYLLKNNSKHLLMLVNLNSQYLHMVSNILIFINTKLVSRV